MQLLVSVANAAEAREALNGGADIIDAKDPTRGALGSLPPATIGEILGAVAGACPVSAALGEYGDDRVYSIGVVNELPPGLAFVKVAIPPTWTVGFATKRVKPIVAAYAPATVVIALYADVSTTLQRSEMVETAERSGARGLLLDTMNKEGPGLFDVLDANEIAEWLDEAHTARLTVALAGRLTASDVARVAALGADVAGVRGAACDGGRQGRISTAKVRALVTTLREIAPRPDRGATAGR